MTEPLTDEEMTNKQLAEKVAKLLGWHPSRCREAVFTWSTVGLMIEDMEREGWEVDWGRNLIDFCVWDAVGAKIIKYTESYNIAKHGYHIAIAKAFVEAKEMINET